MSQSRKWKKKAQENKLRQNSNSNKNCSYFAVAPIEVAQQRLCKLLADLRDKAVEEAASSSGNVEGVVPERPWMSKVVCRTDSAARVCG